MTAQAVAGSIKLTAAQRMNSVYAGDRMQVVM
jgi:hypothetical protein